VETGVAKASAARPLRVALLLDSYAVPRCVRRAVGDVQWSGIAQVVLVVKNDVVTPSGSGRQARSGRRMAKAPQVPVAEDGVA
jgi:hypothetical protein